MRTGTRALQLQTEARIAWRLGIERMRGTWGPANAPACCRGARRLGRRMRDSKTRCASFTSRETQTARRRQIDLIENTNCERQALRFQTIFERNKCFVRSRRLNNQKTRGIEAKAH